MAKRSLYILGLFVFFLSFFSCKKQPVMIDKKIDIQGHRGCRGLLPENTIPAFQRAMMIGVHTLELDVVVNKYGEVIVSHEPFFNHEISTTPDGNEITAQNEKTHNLYPLTIEEIQKYDVGSKPHVRFLIQRNMKVSKPSLREMVIAVDSFAKLKHYPLPQFNIEIKRRPEFDGIYHPPMKDFTNTVLGEIDSLGIMVRSTVQCFDVETLQYIHNTRKDVRLVYLIENKESIENNIKKLGFIPEVYSPYFELVTKDLIKYASEKKTKVIPWTVNEATDIENMLDLGVDGIISDYPDRVVEIYGSRQKG